MEPLEIEPREPRNGAAHLHLGRRAGIATGARAGQIKETGAAGDQRGAGVAKARSEELNPLYSVTYKWFGTLTPRLFGRLVSHLPGPRARPRLASSAEYLTTLGEYGNNGAGIGARLLLLRPHSVLPRPRGGFPQGGWNGPREG